MSLPNFGLPASLIAATRQIVEKKNDEDNGEAKKMEGGKTAVNVNPETDEKINEGEPKKKHTMPKTDKHKKLAALAHPKDKITHKDVLVGRGVINKEEMSSKEKMKRGLYRKEEVEVDEAHQVVATSKDGETFKSGVYDNKKDALSKHYQLAKTGKYKKVDTVKVTKEEVELEEGSVELKPAEFHSVRTGKKSVEDLAKDKKADVGRVRGEYKTHADHWSKGEAHYNKMFKEEVQLSDAEKARIEELAKSFPAEVDEAVKKSVPMATTAVSSPIRGANQDQSGFGTKSSVADYTISDGAKFSNMHGDLTTKKTKAKMAKEEVELDEVSDELKKSYVRSASKDATLANMAKRHSGSEADRQTWAKREMKRKTGLSMALRKEEVELEEGRGRPRKNPLPAGKEPEGDDTHKHPMQQLEKISHAMEGNEPHFEHKDGSKSKIGKHLAKHIVAIHNSMRTTQEKDSFAQKVHANRDSLRSEVSKHF